MVMFGAAGDALLMRLGFVGQQLPAPMPVAVGALALLCLEVVAVQQTLMPAGSASVSSRRTGADP
jgi:hypothetical protein